MKFSIGLILSSILAAANADSSANVLRFSNFGYTGTYNPVLELNDIESDSCSCTLGDAVSFSGTSAPLNEQLSVHFRGPLILHKFATYYSLDFVSDDDSSGDWSRIAYYDGSEGTADNVTFLTTAGTNSTCLGQALTYAGTDGLSEASSSTVLANNTLLNSNEEFSIFSDVTCGSSSLTGDCGVYRDNIPAYKGFDGAVKMFLFEFEMPTDTTSDKSTTNFNAPAIWLLNAAIPRTSQYAQNASCSCWASGCGEFDVFEIMNNTDSSELLTTIHDYQGTGDINTGMAIPGYIERDTDSVMMGGVYFDNDGNAVVFMSNSTTFDETISASSINSWVSDAGEAVTDALSSVTYVAPSSSASSSSSGFAGKVDASFSSRFTLGLFSLMYWLL